MAGEGSIPALAFRRSRRSHSAIAVTIASLRLPGDRRRSSSAISGSSRTATTCFALPVFGRPRGIFVYELSCNRSFLVIR